jgi:hypothetical protein
MPETFIPPESVAKQARIALRWKEKGLAKGAGTRVGWTRARQLADRKPVSLDTIKRIYSYLSRHEVDKKGKDFYNKLKPSKGKISYLNWGGDPAMKWVKSILNKIESKKEVAYSDKPVAWYGYRKVLNPLDIITWARNQGFTNVSNPDDLHVTFCYSKQPFNLPKRDLAKQRLDIIPDKTEYKVFGEDKDTHVIAFSSNQLLEYHNDLRDAGASYDFPEYIPHVSFSKEKTPLSNITPYTGKIILGKERFKEIDKSKSKPEMPVSDAEILAKALACKDTRFMVASESKVKPLDEKLWQKCVKKAQNTFDVWPSRYASYYAAKLYKDSGGKWK